MATPLSAAILPGLAPLQLVEHGLSAPSPAAQARWMQTRFRRRFMEGCWSLPLWEYAQSERDPALLEAMGHLDLSECLYRSVVEQLAVLYEEAPEIRQERGGAEPWREALGELFASHQHLNQAVLAYGEAAIVLDWVGSTVLPILALPDEIDATPIAYGSRELGTFRRVSQRALPTGRGAPVETVCWDCWDIRDRLAPRYEVQHADGAPVAGMTLEGESYPWRFQDGAPFIPAVLYHAMEGHQLWTPHRWVELLWATLESAMTWSDWREGFRNASFLLRYLRDGDIDGATAEGSGQTGRARVPISPSVLLRVRSADPSQPAELGAVSAPIDPLKHAQSIQLRHKLRAHSIGLHPSEVEAGGSAESGVALTVRREGQRREQRRQAPLFRRGDLALLKRWAACMRLINPASAPPEDGWSIRYPALPLTPAERADLRAQEQHDLQHGLRDRAQIIADREQISVEAAVERLVAMAARAAPAAPAAPTAPASGAPAEGAPLPLEAPPPRPEEPEHPYSGRLTYQGLDILIETAAGEERSGVDPDGNAWAVTMPWHYGEIAGTVGLDGDPIDVMVGPLADATDVYVLHLRRPGAEAADEDKAYLGFATPEDALAAFRAAYTRDDILSGLTRWPFSAFLAVVRSGVQGIRLDAPPGSGLPEREPDPATMDAPPESEAEMEPKEEPEEGGAPR